MIPSFYIPTICNLWINVYCWLVLAIMKLRLSFGVLMMKCFIFSCSYFVVQCVAPTSALKTLQTSMRLDEELLRRTMVRIEEPKPLECTLHDELKPPIYRWVTVPGVCSKFIKRLSCISCKILKTGVEVPASPPLQLSST